jgi:putative ABC transport system permease protein
MNQFLIKGLFRDRSRSRLPVLVVTIGVALTVWMHAYITGFMGDAVEMNARFTYGHVKIMSRGYAEEAEMRPIDLALDRTDGLIMKLRSEFPETDWNARILFVGLVDVPGKGRETRAQGQVFGFGIDLINPGSTEPDRLNLRKSIVKGHMPDQFGEVLISNSFADKLKVIPGDTITLISTTMEGSMAMYNLRISGTLVFGVENMDKGTLIADLKDVQQALQMEDAASEITGYLTGGFYSHEQATEIAGKFNLEYAADTSELTPVMKTLSQQGTMGTYVDMVNVWTTYFTLIFVMAMALVLWNAGLLGGLRRYGEIGVRLAMGETKGHIYRSMISESVFIGLAGSVAGTAIGLTLAWIIQKYGIDISGMMKGSAVMFPEKIRARITPADFYLGFFPGVISTLIGTMLAGIGIYKRQTAKLFRELET